MKKRTFIVGGSLVVLLMAAVPLLHAAGLGHHRGGMHEWAMARHLAGLRNQLDLSDAQVTQIKQIAADLKTQNAPYRDQLKSNIHGIATALIANPDDLAAAQAQIEQQSTAEKALKSNVLAAASKALKVLTPEQRTKLGTIVAKHLAEQD